MKKPVAEKTEIFTCAQGEPEWFEARRGIPTASMFATVMASGKGASESKTRRTYMLKLAGEILTEEPMESYTNDHMDRGKEMEAELRKLYDFHTGGADPVEQIGFIRRGKRGCSPDGLIGTKGMLEIKSTLPHLLIELHMRGEFPPAHRSQCQGNLWIAQREWIDIAIGWKKMPLYTQRIHRDETYIAALSAAVDEFNNELAYVVQQMRKLG